MSKKPSPALAVSTVALFAALGGTGSGVSNPCTVTGSAIPVN
jgi:hypothetical protein